MSKVVKARSSFNKGSNAPLYDAYAQWILTPDKMYMYNDY